ncbi:D-threo-aldose 1-dehydrogenase [Chlamydia abortus]|uniref:aldo/keto reductase n=1 Tax=unclassified Paenibacillus TaxID=185978 RepID=UPI000A27EF66|nr:MULTISPECIES: aldo/keto reductase [Paenibacillaceae]SHE11738.1 D-threo-aldose 1-dehydrogenase [Chlamydia abortus]
MMRPTAERKISKLTLGTVQLGIPYGINNREGMLTEEQGLRLLELAWSEGITSFDTAAGYGRAEALLGRFSRGKSPFIITKLKTGVGGRIDPDKLEQNMRKEAIDSLKLLGVSSIPLLMLHNTDVLKEHGDAIEAGLRSLRKEGLIERAGISVAYNTEEEYSLIGSRLLNDLYEAVQLPMNLLDHRPLRNGWLRKLKERGKLVFVRSVFLQGLILMQPNELGKTMAKAKSPLMELHDLAGKYRFPLPQMAVSFVRDCGSADSLIIGAETEGQIRENLRLMAGPPLPEELREEILNRFANIDDAVITPHLWAPR